MEIAQRRFFVLWLLALLGLLPWNACARKDDARREPAAGPVAEHWDSVFRRLEESGLQEGAAFPAYCVQQLLDESHLEKGDRALVLAMGDGRNAIAFARSGLDVTGIDISSVALEQAREGARAAGVQIDAVHADLFRYDLGHEKWDLVTNIFYNPAVRILDQMKDAVRPGGFLLMEGYSSDYLGPGPAHSTRYHSGQLVDALPGWHILEHEEGSFPCDWVNGRSIPTVRLLVQKPL